MTFENTVNLGWEFLKDNTVIHAWNKHNDYYFDADNGIQLTNHYEEYWTRNVMMLGYYTGTTWNLVYRTDELTGFTRVFEGISDEYIQLTLYKDLSYGSYNFRLAIRYKLSINDHDLTIIPYIKNLGIAIPYTLGFGWEIKDIKIGNTQENNQIRIDDTNYLLNQSLDSQYTNITQTEGDNGLHTGLDNASILTNNEANWIDDQLIGKTIQNTTDGSSGIITTNTSTTITATLTGGADNDWDTNDVYYFEYQIPSPTFQLYHLEGGSSRKLLYLKWDKDLDYLVWVKSRTGQYNAPVSLFIKIGTLSISQEKFTTMYWLDASTFGDPTLSGTNDDPLEEYINAGYFQMGAIGGTGNSITVKLRIVTAAHKVKCALYDSDSNLVLNGVTEEITVPVQGATATTFNFVGTKPILTANAFYYICTWAENTTGSADNYIAGGGLGYVIKGLAYGSYPSSIVFEPYMEDGLMAIYCTYETGEAVDAAKENIILDSSNALGNDVYLDTDKLGTPECRLKTLDY